MIQDEGFQAPGCLFGCLFNINIITRPFYLRIMFLGVLALSVMELIFLTTVRIGLWFRFVIKNVFSTAGQCSHSIMVSFAPPHPSSQEAGVEQRTGRGHSQES